MEVQAFGFMVADELPNGVLDLSPAVRVKRATPDEITQWRRERPQPRLDATEAAPASLVTAPPDVRVTSAWAVWFRVNAADVSAAEQVLQTSLIPALETAFVAATGAPAVVDLLRLGEADATGRMARIQTPFTLSGSLRLFDPRPLSPQGEATAREVFARTTRPGVAQDVARLMANAQRAEYYSGGTRPLAAAALLGYFHVIERITGVIAKKSQAEFDSDAAQDILERVRRQLTGKASLGQQVRVVTNAAHDLDRLRGASLSERVQKAGTTLDVGDAALRGADRLAKLRNTRLGHPSSAVVDDDLSTHLAEAHATATAFLRALLTG